MGGPFDDPVVAMIEIYEQPGLAFFCFTAALAVLVLNLASMYTVRKVSAVFRMVWSTMNNISIWIISIALGLETFELKKSSVQLLGFIFLVMGTFTYNGIIVWPIPYFKTDLNKDNTTINNKAINDDDEKTGPFGVDENSMLTNAQKTVQ